MVGRFFRSAVLPSYLITPDWGLSSVARSFIKVLFPAPLEPSTILIPPEKEHEIPSNTDLAFLYEKLNPLTSMRIVS